MKPDPDTIRNAANKTLADVIAPDLQVLFCGINPGLYSAAVGHNFARPGNRFWPVLFRSGFTERLLLPSEEEELLLFGCGITNIVNRATAAADELDKSELLAGAKELTAKVHLYKPRYLAVVGLGAYRTAFQSPKAEVGLQTETIAETRIWVLPNTSGLNAHYQVHHLILVFQELRDHVFGDR